MAGLGKRPHDAIAQLLEYADSGRLLEVERPKGNAALVAVVVASAMAFGLGAGLVVLTLATDLGVVGLLLGLTALISGFGVLAPALRLLREAAAAPAVPVKPGAVLPPDLVRKGHWIFRSGAWLRVEQVGRDGGGRIHALLGTGDVVELHSSVTVAGDHFRPVADSIETIRS